MWNWIYSAKWSAGVALSPDISPEREFLPQPPEVSGALLLADRGYYDQSYFQALDAAGGGFIIRGKADITPGHC